MTAATLITARLKSTRLPMKAFKRICGRPLLDHLVERLRLATRPERLIICTSDLAQDDLLAAHGESIGVEVFRGDPDDVLLRLTDAADAYGVETVVSCTADNPLVDPEYIDRLVEFHSMGGFDYSRSEGLPFGTFAYALSHSAMRRACQLKADSNTEVWGGYFTEPGMFRCGVMEVDDPAVRWPELRLTVDVPEDFELVSRVFDALYEEGRVFSLAEIVRLCREHPELPRINAHVKQKTPRAVRFKERFT